MKDIKACNKALKVRKRKEFVLWGKVKKAYLP
jgi:hypothetical protein